MYYNTCCTSSIIYIGLDDYKCTINDAVLHEIEEDFCENLLAAVADSICTYSLPSSFEEVLERYFVLVEILDQCNLY